jgi:hypothetical protein
VTEESEQLEATTTDEVAGARSTTTSDDPDRAAESFLDLEADAVPAPADRVWGRAVDVAVVPVAEVPEGYPVDIATAEALALSLDVRGERVQTYFAFDEDLTDDRLGRLLALKDISPDRFADLHGESVCLSVEDGHYVPVVPDEPPRGSAVGGYGIPAILSASLIGLWLAAAGGGALVVGFGVALWLLTLVVLPVATYFDAWHLRTRTDWDGGPLFWATLALVPGVNLLASAVYLLGRRRATRL